MRTLLENTYGFDVNHHAPGIPAKTHRALYGDPYLHFLPDQMFEAVSVIFRVPKYLLIDDEETMRDSDGSHYRVAMSSSTLDGNAPIRDDQNPHFDTSSKLFQKNFLFLRQAAAQRVLDLWHGTEDGYTYADFEQFMHRVVAQIDHIEQSWDGVRETVSDQYFMMLYEGIFGHREGNCYSVSGVIPRTWRYVALRLMESPDPAIMGPSTGNIISYGSLAPTMETVSDRGVNASAFMHVGYDYDHFAIHATIQEFFSYPHCDRVTGNLTMPRNTGLLRHIEMNEFLHHGEPEQTLEDFLAHTPWLTDRVRELRVHDYGDTTAILTQNKENYQTLPYFLRFYDTFNMPLGVQKIVLNLTRDQWYALYQNPAKRPSILRTDAKSRSKNFVEGYLAAFFDEGDRLEDYLIDAQECQELVMETVLHGDMATYFAARTVNAPSRRGTPRPGASNAVHEMLMAFLQDVYRGGGLIFMRRDKTAFFNLLHQYDGFQGRSMAARMILMYCLDTPELFSYDTGGAESAITVLGNAILSHDISARTAAQFILHAATNDMKRVPVVDKTALHIMKQHTGTTPVAWYMELLDMRERQNVLPTTFFKLAQIEGAL